MLFKINDFLEQTTTLSLVLTLVGNEAKRDQEEKVGDFYFYGQGHKAKILVIQRNTFQLSSTPQKGKFSTCFLLIKSRRTNQYLRVVAE